MATRRATAARKPKSLVPPPLVRGYVLHGWDWSETSLVVECFTRERGRIAVVARGAKRPFSQLRAVLLPFQRVELVLGRTPAAGRPGARDGDSGAGDEALPEIHTLKTCERLPGPPMPPPALLFAGLHLNELLMRLLARDDPHPALFDAYDEAVHALLPGDESLAQVALRAFELVLLRELGVLPALDRETLTLAPLGADARYTLHAEHGVVRAEPDDAALDGRTWAALEAALADAAASGQRGQLRAVVARCAAALRAPLRPLLHYHLGGRRLRTRELMVDLQRLQPATRGHLPR